MAEISAASTEGSVHPNVPEIRQERNKQTSHSPHSNTPNSELTSRYEDQVVSMPTNMLTSRIIDSDQNIYEFSNVTNNRRGMQSTELNHLTSNNIGNNNSVKENLFGAGTTVVVDRNNLHNINESNESTDLNGNFIADSSCEFDTSANKINANNVNDIQSLQEKYSNAIEEFRVFRAKLALNMERNLIRTEQFNLKKSGNRYRSQEDISKSSLDVSATGPFETTYRQLSRYASQEQLSRRVQNPDDKTQILERSRTADYFKASPVPNRTNQMLNSSSNSNNMDSTMGTSSPTRQMSEYNHLNQSELRQHREQCRDQAARSNFERYLRGSAASLRHHNSSDLNDSKRDSAIFEEAIDIGYGGSGSTSPNQHEGIMLTSDQLSSRSGSVNSHHSQASSALASVDSGVRMSFVGQHNSLVVVAIDFGTTFSGYAFAFTRDSSSIHMMRRWEGGDPGVTNQKTPTTLLLKPDGAFHSFGFGARDFYHDLDASDAKKWLYFDKFKMTLHSNKDLHAGYEIKAANGKMYPALKVFSHALQFFRDHVLSELSDQSTAKLTEDDITWVLTVPAIWRAPAKQFMRTAAYEAGIASPDTPDRLLIALEPEAASIFCRKLRIRDCVIEDDLKAKAGDDSLISEDFEGVTQYIVVDCGGGTVDLTVHELDVAHGTLKELHKGTGGPSGATGVDREFEDLLKRIFDPEFIERFKVKRPAAWVDLMISFEAKKRTARVDSSTPLNISLPFSFIEYHKKHRKCSVESAVKKIKNPDIKWSQQGMLRLSACIMQNLFDPVVLKVINHIKELLTKPTLQRVEHLFLVGGFAESPLLQHSIRSALEGRVRVIIPNDVGLAILKGAVLFGLDPTIIRIRRATHTYGVGVLNKFDPLKHEQSKRVVKDGIVWCKDIFDKFVTVDESVGIGDRVTRSYAPARAKQTSTVINIYCTESSDVLYTTDKGVSRCGKLRMEMPDIKPEDIPVEKRGRPRELQASMVFGDTEVKVSALDVLSGRAARATIDFLNY